MHVSAQQLVLAPGSAVFGRHSLSGRSDKLFAAVPTLTSIVIKQPTQPIT